METQVQAGAIKSVNAGILAMRAANALRKASGASSAPKASKGGGGPGSVDGGDRKARKSAVKLVAHLWRVVLAHEPQPGVQAAFACEVSAPTVRRAAKQARLEAHKAKLEGKVGAVVAVAREDAPQALWAAASGK